MNQKTGQNSTCWNCIHLFIGFVAVVLSLVSLYCDWPPVIPKVIITVVDIYIVLILLEAAIRSGKLNIEKVNVTLPNNIERVLSLPALKPSTSQKEHYIFEFPDRTWSLLQILFLFVIVITAFGRMYIYSEGIMKVSTDKECVEIVKDCSKPDFKNDCCETKYLERPIDSIYFSLGVLTTSGSGDYVPVTDGARNIVMWELVTSILLVIGVLQFLISRVANF
jgi:hypothetical protein